MLCRQQTSTKEIQGKGQSHWDPTHSKARGGAEAASERASPDEIGDRSKGARGNGVKASCPRRDDGSRPNSCQASRSRVRALTFRVAAKRYSENG